MGIPTETVYGLAANAWDHQAVLKIFQAKNRPHFNPLILHSNSIQKFESFGLNFSEKALLLAEKFWPGPLTIVIPKSSLVPDLITSGTDAVAIRIPNHPIALDLLESINFPLAAPSANPSGFVSPTNAEHVLAQLGDQVHYVLDGGQCSIGLESTIISFLNEQPEILRFGGLALESIESIIGKINIPILGYSDNPVAPGMLKKHYATRHQMLRGEIKDLLKHFPADRVALISFNEFFEEVDPDKQFILSRDGSLEEAASNLFSAMRQADALDVDIILAAIFPNIGLGRAINDRLNRASATDS